MTSWMVRAGRNTAYAEDFLQHGVVAIGFHRRAWVPGAKKADLLAAVRQADPTLAEGKALNVAGQLYRFATELAVGDDVATYDSGRRLYYLGKITSEIQWDERLIPD